jgi:hypothetical protein
MDLTVFIEIQGWCTRTIHCALLYYCRTKGKRNFIISDSVYYQFCEATPASTAQPSHIPRLNSTVYGLYLGGITVAVLLDITQLHLFHLPIMMLVILIQAILTDTEVQFQA